MLHQATTSCRSIALPAWVLLLTSLLVATPALAQLQAATRHADLSGVVVDASGTPVPFAYVYERGSGRSTVSRADGTFRISDVPLGSSRILGARRLGYRPVELSVEPTQSGFPVTELVLAALPQMLEATEVVETFAGYDEYLDRRGYYRRQAREADASFIGFDEISRRNPNRITSLFHGLRGVRVETHNGKGGAVNVVQGRGRRCAMGLVLDGQLVRLLVPSNEGLRPSLSLMSGRGAATQTQISATGTATMDEMLPVGMLGGIEVYPSASSVPTEFQKYVDGCGLIVAWTKYDATK